jgi:trk system potassium uptake protein TrkA
MSLSDKKNKARKKRSVAVIGLSSFGYYLCRFLSDITSEVLAIDVNEDRVNQVKSFVKKAVVADAKNKETLANLGLKEFDVVIVSVGENIEASILISLYLNELGVKEVLAKAVTEDHAKILHIIGAETIVFPERDMAKRVANTFYSPNLLDYIALMDDYSIVELAPPRKWIGKTLAELQIRKQYHVQVAMVKEIVPDNVILIPGGDYVVKDSDILIVIGQNEDLNNIESA